GLDRFLRACGEKEIRVFIISHKTQFPVIGPRVNLREAALHWLERNSFRDALGIRKEDVFFDSTREEKIQRIVEQRCSYFVDDLEEVFLEPAFPTNVGKLLFAQGAKDDLNGAIKVFSSWDSIRNYLLEVT